MDLRSVVPILNEELGWVPFREEPDHVTFYAIGGRGGPYPEGGRYLVAQLDLDPEGAMLYIQFEESPDVRYEEIDDSLDAQEIADRITEAYIDHLGEVAEAEVDYWAEQGVKWNPPPIDLENRPGTYLGQYFGGYYGRVPWPGV